jgi:hypothetical protein
MAEPCDCLNDCGDDERVGQYLVEPCPGMLLTRQRLLARMQAEVSLIEEAKRYRLIRSRVDAGAWQLLGAESGAQLDFLIDHIRDLPEVSR